MGDEDLVVVGVDGSVSALRALEFGLEEAARREGRVRAVIAYYPPQAWPVVYGYGMGPAVPEPSRQDVINAAEETIRNAVTEATTKVGREAAAVPTEVRVVPGDPVSVLLDESAGASMLVVGHRGRGGFASMCLGSVGLQSVLHGACPVTVVR